MSEVAKCELCGEPMPAGEEMFKFHGYSGNCPKPPLPKEIKEAPEAIEYQRDVMADALRQIADAEGTYVSIAIFAVNKAKEILAVSGKSP